MSIDPYWTRAKARAQTLGGLPESHVLGGQEGIPLS